MPIESRQVTAGGSAVMLVSGDGMGCHVSVFCEHTQGETHALYFGGSDVTASNGFRLAPGLMWQETIGPGDDLFAVTGGAEDVVTVMIVRQD